MEFKKYGPSDESKKKYEDAKKNLSNKIQIIILYIISISISILFYLNISKLNKAKLDLTNIIKENDSLKTQNIYLYHENYIYDLTITKMCDEDSLFCKKFEEFKNNTE